MNQMTWLSPMEGGDKILHLRSHPDDPWRSYKHPIYQHITVTDYNIPNGSKGMATMHYLLRLGWTIVAP
jgi:hypothetical protein